MTPPSLLLKRRRVKKENSHTSSREASEESNAETDVGITEDDEPPVAHEFAKPARRISKGSVGRSMATLHEHKPDSLTDEVDSGTSTYDGDISSATAPSKRHPGMAHCDSTPNPGHPTRTRPASSGASTASPPSSSPPSPVPQPRQPAFHHPAPHGMISKLKAEELQEGVRAMIAGQSSVDGAQRDYRINEPPVGRPIRIYADGVYDLFHYAHALQLRQAKLFFPEVTLVVGVCSDELVLRHKAHPVLNEEERYESVRNCKWVDEVIEDAPWIITEEFLVKHKIDYVAHDEEPYKSAGSDDVYAFVKSIGKFLPTRRTSGISTSELLSRIVDGYRGGEYDNKLEKIGRSDIMSRPGSEAGSQRRLSASHDALPCGLAQIHLASPDRSTANQN